MRSVGVLMSFALGCGRIGFDLCTAGCGTSSTSGIQRISVASPGTSSDSSQLTFPLAMTAGDVTVVASYATSDLGSVSDAFGGTWNTLPQESQPCGTPVSVRFFYSVATQTGDDTIKIDANSNENRGAFAVTYSGTAAIPIDTAAGTIGTTNATTLTAGSVDTTNDDQIVAVFVTAGPLTISPDAAYRRLAQDDDFAAVLEDLASPPATITPTATIPQPSSCWVAASVALLPK